MFISCRCTNAIFLKNGKGWVQKKFKLGPDPPTPPIMKKNKVIFL